MQQIVTYITTLIFLYSCSSRTDSQTATSSDTPQVKTVDTVAEVALWADDFVIKYLDGNKDRLTEVDGHPVTYIKEPMECENRSYAAVRIGHSFEHRYVTEQWIYIDSLTKDIYEYDVANDSLILWNGAAANFSLTDTIIPNGKYRFDIAFAEWGGKSMGEKVTVMVSGSTIKIIYEGDGKLTSMKKGDIIDQGRLMKHKTGVWIIGKAASDAQLDEIGGCTGGPAIIDLRKKKYWMC